MFRDAFRIFMAMGHLFYILSRRRVQRLFVQVDTISSTRRPPPSISRRVASRRVPALHVHRTILPSTRRQLQSGRVLVARHVQASCEVIKWVFVKPGRYLNMRKNGTHSIETVSTKFTVNNYFVLVACVVSCRTCFFLSNVLKTHKQEPKQMPFRRCFLVYFQ